MTNHHHAESSDQVPWLEIERAGKRGRLENLLTLRDGLGVITAERRSHRLGDDRRYEVDQTDVEWMIHEEFPQVYTAMWPTWVDHDHAAEHPPRVLTDGCGICEAIAAATGVNLTRPVEDD
jgi:hypothetical protein